MAYANTIERRSQHPLSVGSSTREAVGFAKRTKCLACGKKKHSSESHPKCSKKLQKMHKRGEL
jgi:hypothetical protein